MVAPAGIEPATLGLADRHSVQLSYEATMVLTAGLEPAIPARDRGFKDHCVCQFRHVSVTRSTSPPRAGFFVILPYQTALVAKQHITKR